MKKSFCDICGEPAVEGLHGKRALLPVGEPVKEYRCRSDGGGCEGTFKTMATASIHFGFTDHPTGFGGPPDMCRACAGKLAQMIADEIGKAKP
jgi:hypothetical protein